MATPSFAGGIHAVFYGFDMAMMLNGVMSELMFGNMGAGIPTFVRNGNSTAAYQVESLTAVTNENVWVTS